jgi:hypothetical protein
LAGIPGFDSNRPVIDVETIFRHESPPDLVKPVQKALKRATSDHKNLRSRIKIVGGPEPVNPRGEWH